ncbi:hypothetical protein ACFV28_13540 [Streptomyces sp. NPDC059720]|uniref:hypothetical protein n=1 Tax=Streptomyces sp. NPDC059720 TaxID=3346924 RepID=UPI0036B4D233
MKRRAQAPAPTPPACAECARLDNLRQAAENEGDLSRATDCRVLLRRHRADAHAPEPQFEGEL